MKIKRESILKAIESIKTKFDDNFNEKTKIKSKIDAHNFFNTVLGLSALEQFKELNNSKIEYGLYLDKTGKTKFSVHIIIYDLGDLLSLISSIDITKIDVNNFKYLKDPKGNDYLCYVQDIPFEYE